MNDGFRQRLVGAVVLICLGLILWPVIFTDGGGIEVDRSSRIPSAPSFEKYTLIEPQQPENVLPITRYHEQADLMQGPPPETRPAPPEPIKPNTIKPEPQLTKQGLPIYWALQVASFKQDQRAKKLKKALIGQGYKVLTRSVKTPLGQAIRVYVGPKIDRSVLKKQQVKIDAAFNVKSMIVRFTP